MQTEIDQYLAQQNELLNQQNKLLAEQNALLMQQVDSLKNVLNSYDKLNQGLNNKINSLETENETKKELISAMKLELLKLEQGKFSEEYQQKLLNNWNNQYLQLWTKALQNQDLIDMLRSIVQEETKSEKTQLMTALLKVSQMPAPQDYSEEIETLISSVSNLNTQMRSVMSLIERLID